MTAFQTRKDVILGRVCATKFEIKENPKASGKAPFYEVTAFSEVKRHGPLIDRVSRETGVDARLIRAIMFMETTHGYYDMPLSWFDKNKSILPMNINIDYWGDEFGDRDDMKDPYKNIQAGAAILLGIISNLPRDASIAQIATLYNNLNATVVTDYGMRVQKIYEDEPWASAAPTDSESSSE